MRNHSATVSQTVYDQIRHMTRTALVTPDTFYMVGDRITFYSSDEPAGIDRYVSLVEAVGLSSALVCFTWPLAAATKALVNYCDTAESVEDAVKMLQVLDVLRPALK